MLRRDYIQAEMQKLGQILARIIGLKRDGLPDVAEKLLEDTLAEQFQLEPANLQNLTAEQFVSRINFESLPAEKVDLLARFLFESVHPFQLNNKTRDMLLKVLALYHVLEVEFHQQSLENLQRRTTIKKFLEEAHE